MKKDSSKNVSVIEKIKLDILKKNLFKNKSKILVGMSGGQDSMCSVLFFFLLKVQWQLQYGIITCNHLWQRDSFYSCSHSLKIAYVFDESFSLSLCPFWLSCEKDGRKWRYSVFRRIGYFYIFPFISVAHTETDRVETLFFQLLRGSGISGILGIQWKRKIKKAFPKNKERSLFYKSCEFLLKNENIQSRKKCKKQKLFFKNFVYRLKSFKENLKFFQFKKLKTLKQKKIFILYFSTFSPFFLIEKKSVETKYNKKQNIILETGVILFVSYLRHRDLKKGFPFFPSRSFSKGKAKGKGTYEEKRNHSLETKVSKNLEVDGVRWPPLSPSPEGTTEAVYLVPPYALRKGEMQQGKDLVPPYALRKGEMQEGDDSRSSSVPAYIPSFSLPERGRYRQQRVKELEELENFVETKVSLYLSTRSEKGEFSIQFCESNFFFIRPLLGITRFHTHLFCKGWILPIYSDRSNQSSSYTRNCIRNQLLPLLKKLINPRLERTVSQFADIILQENLYIEKIIKKLKNILYFSKKKANSSSLEIKKNVSFFLSFEKSRKKFSLKNFNSPIKFIFLIKKNIFFGRGWYFESFLKEDLQLKNFISIETKKKIFRRKELEKRRTNLCKFLIGDTKASIFSVQQTNLCNFSIPFNISFFEEISSNFSSVSFDKRFFISLLRASPLSIKRRFTKNALEDLKITKIDFHKIDTFVKKESSPNFKRRFFIRQNYSTQSFKEFELKKIIFFFLTYDSLNESIFTLINKFPKKKKHIVFIPSVGTIFYFL
jgi:tRNA(Ile)-lysidine synthase TilS/MesJ